MINQDVSSPIYDFKKNDGRVIGFQENISSLTLRNFIDCLNTKSKNNMKLWCLWFLKLLYLTLKYSIPVLLVLLLQTAGS